MEFSSYVEVVQDLSKELSSRERFERLLQAIRQAIPCDAIALLRLRGDVLEPVVFDGLLPETQGRRFRLGEHPRLDRILSSRSVVRFDCDTEMADPYDGLVSDVEGSLHVHDCMGISLYVEDSPWGVITLDAMRPGQFDDVDPQQQLAAVALTRAVITAAYRIELLEQKVSHGHSVTAEMNRELAEREIIGRSPAIQSLLQDIETVSQTSLAVLLQGETGVGKEIVARRLHLQSDRYDEALVQINCAALPENMAEAELFGHTKGAFTGADSARSGRFELADKGTLFLDEVGELPLVLQSKLLRVLQEGEIQRMGSDESIYVDVRIIAATNRDLREEVSSGRFRADLYHRLSVYPVTVPTLRERNDDVLMLAEYFLERDQRRLKVNKLLLTASAREALLRYSWPGNVRELEHVLSRSALRAARQQNGRRLVQIGVSELQLSSEDHAGGQGRVTLPSSVKEGDLEELSLKQQLEQFQRSLIERALSHANNNVAEAARSLKVDRSNLLRLIKRLGIALK
ncbi:MAG: nitric oxide reductase transcriptional regulator NorR [Cellvibrionaceae bacterium]|nr:nitric oxide reductase transcriptional regulator NorR [Cellvibrionaceae bacterium]|tara:strand:- start:4720 stop:6267 length:1548 start_codon:yes stop_codon:yes gene_type:complete